jgi:hypothetical protein
MQRHAKVVILSLLSLSLSIFVIYNTFYFYNVFTKDITIIDKNVYSKSLPNSNFKSNYNSKINFLDSSITKIQGVSLNILNQTKLTDVPMLLKSQRYYIPVNFICDKLNYTLEISNNSILLCNNETKIILTNTNYTKNSKTTALRGNLVTSNNTYYISISDIEELFDLIAIFDFKNNNISLLSNNIKLPEESSILYSNKVALIRFEDFGCGYSNISDKNQTKIKLMTNLLYSNGIKFHVSWIPRFVVPSSNFDNNLLTNDNIINAGFVNVLDYMINKGGEIGLHGYTHQSGNDASGNGEEMSNTINNTEPETRSVIEKGIDTASALNIPISYYESPHYRDTLEQKKIISEYFQFLYEPYEYSKKDNIYKPDPSHLFVPTPLGRIADPSKDVSNMIDNINHFNPNILKSFYYHPSIEIDYINFYINDNKLSVIYDENSPLQSIVKALKNNKYTTLHIDQLINK